MLMEEREYRGRPGGERYLCWARGARKVGLAGAFIVRAPPLVYSLDAHFLETPPSALLYLRQVALSCTQHCLTSSTRGAVPLATHRPPFHRRPTRRVAKTTSRHVPSAPPAQAKNSKARSGPRGEPITAGSSRSGAISPRRKAIPRVAMIGPLAGPHC